MRFCLSAGTHSAAKYILLWVLLLFASVIFAQKSKADSLQKLLSTEKVDSIRVKLQWQRAEIVSMYSPDSALPIAQAALSYAIKIKYPEGQSRSLSIMANANFRMGNYPNALALYFEKLKLDEQRNIPRNLASVLMNIGVLYSMQEEYNKALQYYYLADSVIQKNNVEEMKYYIFLNLGDVYNRLDRLDSSLAYFNKSLTLAQKQNDTDLIANSLTGLGHGYRKQGRLNESLSNYRIAIAGLQSVNDDETLSEAELGMARLQQQFNNKDSAGFYATQSLLVARRGNFLSHELEAALFLTNHYKTSNNTDSAYAYVNRVQQLNDTINSKTRIRELQILSTNEQLRQQEIEENKIIAAEERHQQLQLLFIGIFIPGFFLFTLLSSRIRIHVRIVKALGVLSLLIFFEYLTLLLHPYVLEFTHHTPVYEILIFVLIAAVLIPSHHRIEHWLVEKLISKKSQPDKTIRLTTKKIKMKF